jgi:hypothetical protein
MLSLQQLRKNLYPLFKLMRDTGYVYEIVYDGVVYDMYVRRTKKSPKLTRAKRERKGGQTVQQLDMSPCPSCDSLRVNDICLNTRCPSNL